MKNTIILLLLSIFLTSHFSCKDADNLCETVICENGGECDAEGNCICPPEFTGANCELLANPKEIRIKKIIVTDFLAMNGSQEWDTSDGPDIFIEMSESTVPGGMVLNETEIIENAVHGNEYEFIVDWPMGGNELAYNFNLRDDDPEIGQGFSSPMGSNNIYPMDHRTEKPTVIDLPTLSGGFVGLRLEVEWIFE